VKLKLERELKTSNGESKTIESAKDLLEFRIISNLSTKDFQKSIG
jgi:hypothetical protein